MKTKFAFTIVELLAVAIIISILVGVGISAYNSSIYRSRTVTFQENVNGVVDCLNVYFSIKHRYPDSLEEIRGCLNHTPVNPFTGRDMITDGSIVYIQLDGGLEYTIVINQPNK